MLPVLGGGKTKGLSEGTGEIVDVDKAVLRGNIGDGAVGGGQGGAHMVHPHKGQILLGTHTHICLKHPGEVRGIDVQILAQNMDPQVCAEVFVYVILHGEDPVPHIGVEHKQSRAILGPVGTDQKFYYKASLQFFGVWLPETGIVLRNHCAENRLEAGNIPHPDAVIKFCRVIPQNSKKDRIDGLEGNDLRGNGEHIALIRPSDQTGVVAFVIAQKDQIALFCLYSLGGQRQLHLTGCDEKDLVVLMGMKRGRVGAG